MVARSFERSPVPGFEVISWGHFVDEAEAATADRLEVMAAWSELASQIRNVNTNERALD